MSKRTDTTPILIFLGIVIAFIQILDIVLHVATDQFELLRVTSNLVILLWLAAIVARRPGARSPRIAALFIGAYLALNLIFLVIEGVTNDGQLRTVLLVFVFFTVALSALLAYMLAQPRKG